MDTSEIELFAEETDVGYAEVNPAYYVIGACGEVGEIAELHKKQMRNPNLDGFQDKLAKEIGDVLWYLSRLANTNGLTLAECWDRTRAKLVQRHNDGYYTK